MEQLAVHDLRALCESAEALLLDVREAWEVERAALHLPGVAFKHIPMGLVPERLAELDRARPIVCICHHGVRSLHVAAYLAREGFERVYNLTGGIDAWSAEIDAAVPRY